MGTCLVSEVSTRFEILDMAATLAGYASPVPKDIDERGMLG